MSLRGALLKYSFTISCIFGILVDPPTKTISSILSFVNFASSNAFVIKGIHF